MATGYVDIIYLREGMFRMLSEAVTLAHFEICIQPLTLWACLKMSMIQILYLAKLRNTVTLKMGLLIIGGRSPSTAWCGAALELEGRAGDVTSVQSEHARGDTRD